MEQSTGILSGDRTGCDVMIGGEGAYLFLCGLICFAVPGLCVFIAGGIVCASHHAMRGHRGSRPHVDNG